MLLAPLSVNVKVTGQRLERPRSVSTALGMSRCAAKSANRRTPRKQSRRISSVHRSPTTSKSRARWRRAGCRPDFPVARSWASGCWGWRPGQLAMAFVGPSWTWLAFLPGMFVAGVFSGLLNAALGREAVATVPEGEGALGSGANNTARYLGSAVGVTVVAVIAAAGDGTGVQGLVDGWNHAALVTVVVSVVGGLVALVLREPRAPGTGAHRRTGRYARRPGPRLTPAAGAGSPLGAGLPEVLEILARHLDRGQLHVLRDDQRYRSAAAGADRHPAPLPQPTLDVGRQ